jgi:predicted PurR-regulated permease PerM
MLSLLGSLLGFGTSFLPKVMDYFQDKADKAHELKVMEMQMKAQSEAHVQRLEEINTQADIDQMKAMYKHDSSLHENAASWTSTLSASVRPVITYAFFGLFTFVEVSAYMALTDKGLSAGDAVQVIWSEDTQSLFAAVISFWFGNRMVSKWNKK